MEVALVLSCCLAALLLYSNTLDAQFAYDDSRAIKTNPDVLPSAPLLQVFLNDFWGTPLTHSGSHKSYRPLTVLSFRLNYAIAEFDPLVYHATNVFLHVIATGLFALLTSTIAPHARLFGFTAPLFFAAHPIHTEAVSGVVGRADVGAAIFLLLALLSYIKHCKKSSSLSCGNDGTKNHHSHNSYSSHHVSSWSLPPGGTGNTSTSSSTSVGLAACGSSQSASNNHGGNDLRVSAAQRNACVSKLYLILTIVFSALSMLTKELGITALAVCAAHRLFIHSKIRLKDLPTLIRERRQSGGVWPALGVLVGCAALLLGARLVIMGALPPEFAPADNPAADCDNAIVRGLTFMFLPAFNFWLLLCPATLSFDWSMEAVPLVTSFADPRNLASLLFYGGLATLGLFYLSGWKRPWSGPGPVGSRRWALDDGPSTGDDVVILALALLVLPFLPATNLFFYVGFVVAERILYIPSMGFCLLVSWGIHVLHSRAKSARVRKLLCAAVALLFLLFAARTWRRNQDWATEENLYRSGIPINPPKAYGNLANILSSRGHKEEAEVAYKKALSYRSNMADVHYNLGILFQEQKRFEESIREYRLAIQFRPRMAMAHLNLGLVLGLVGRKEEAIEVYRQCSQLDGSGLKDPRTHEATKISALFNLGRLYADDGLYERAIGVYMEAVDRMPPHYAPQSLYNMLGEAYFKLERLGEAERWYLEALRVKSDHVPAHLTYGKLLARMNRVSEAEDWFRKALSLAPNDSSVHQHYGQFLSESERHEDAAHHYVQAAVIAPTEYETVINAANTLRQAGRNRDAERYYRMAVALRPQDATSHMNLGAMLHVNGKLLEAEASYLEALRLKPDDSITSTNLQKLRHLLLKKGISPAR